LAKFEDHDVTNQFSIMGSIKPGPVRLWTAIFILRLVDYFARHVYNRGRFARIRTIHFARWVFLDDRKRMAFSATTTEASKAIWTISSTRLGSASTSFSATS
jgi:hypothetical protein